MLLNKSPMKMCLGEGGSAKGGGGGGGRAKVIGGGGGGQENTRTHKESHRMQVDALSMAEPIS